LSETTNEFESGPLVTIPEDGKGGEGNIIHKSKFKHMVLKEVRVDFVKRFLQVKFESNIIIIILGLLHVVKYFLQYNNIVRSTLSRRKLL